MSAEFAYKNYPVKFTVYMFDIDITHDVEDFGNIEASLDYPQISEFRIGEANLVLRDYDEIGNVGMKYNPEYEGNFFSKYALQSGYKSPVRIEVQFLVSGELKPEVPIIIFEGKILSLNKGLKEGTVSITCSDLTQEFRTKNVDNFGIHKQISLAKGELSQRAGNYPIPYLLSPPSEDSVIAISPPGLKQVDRLKNFGELDHNKFVVTDRSIQIEDGFRTYEVEEEEDGEIVKTVKDEEPIIFFKAPYRDKKIEDLVKKIISHYNITDSEVEIPTPELENRFFTNLGRVGYDFDKEESKEKWRWEGFVTDFICGENLNQLNEFPFGYFHWSSEGELSEPCGLVDGGNYFYTIQGVMSEGFIFTINEITGRVTKKFQFRTNGNFSSDTPLKDGLVFYENELLVLTDSLGSDRIFRIDPFLKDRPSLDLLNANPIKIATKVLTLKDSSQEHSIINNSGKIINNQDNGSLSRSLVFFDEKLYLVKENGLWQIELNENKDTATFTRIKLFEEDWNNSPKMVCATSYNGTLYAIGKKTGKSSKLYKINHYTGDYSLINIELPAEYDPVSLNPYKESLYSLAPLDSLDPSYSSEKRKIERVLLKINPYSISKESLYKNSGGDKLFFLYSSNNLLTFPKIVEYDIKTDTYTDLYSHVSGTGQNKVSKHAEFWKITSVDYKTFYILGTEPYVGEKNEFLGIYNSSDANYASPSRVKIWKFDRVTLDFEVYIDQDTFPESSRTPLTPIEQDTFPPGVAPPQLAQYYHDFAPYPDSRKNFQVIETSSGVYLYYIWANRKRFGVAQATGVDGDGKADNIKRVFIANNDNFYNSCGCDFVIDDDKKFIYGAFTFINDRHKNSTLNIARHTIPLPP